MYFALTLHSHHHNTLQRTSSSFASRLTLCLLITRPSTSPVAFFLHYCWGWVGGSEHPRPLPFLEHRRLLNTSVLHASVSSSAFSSARIRPPQTELALAPIRGSRVHCLGLFCRRMRRKPAVSFFLFFLWMQMGRVTDARVRLLFPTSVCGSSASGPPGSSL